MVDEQATLQGVHPILRNPDVRNRTASPVSMSPRSQVRFSVPDINLMNESQTSVSESPSKIVFPKGSEEDSIYESANEDISEGLRNLGKEGHFMDMHSRVMIDVPEEIWDFHTKRRLTKHRRSKSTGDQSIYSDNGNDDLGISRSLQSIIVDTLDSMGKFKERYTAENSNSEDSSGMSQVSPLNIRREASYDLYLTPYSPLNNYNVPIPVEISLPPFLSPENKERKRGSLIFDGKHYSPFNIDSHESSTEADDEDGEKSNESSRASADDEEEDSISADSIPSAVHDISFDVNSLNDVDQELGIDQDANVNLKVQRKNLKSQSPLKSSPLTKKSHAMSASRNLKNQQVPNLSAAQEPEINGEPPLDQEGIEDDEEQSEQEALAPVLSRQSLEILETPSKQIHIPDFDSDPTPATSTAGSLTFFDTLEDNNEEFSTNPNREVGKLDMEFKFPPLPPKEDEDFVKTDASPTDPQFEARRNKLMQQKVLTPGGRRHMHSRSRSMHNVEDMFVATSTPPTNAAAETSDKSPLRQDYSVHKDAADFEIGRSKRQISARESPRGFAEDEFGLPITPTPFARYNSELPATPSPTDKSRSELAMTPTPFSRRRRGKPITPAPFEEHVHEVDMTPESEPYAEHEASDPSSVYEEIHASKGQPSRELHKPTINQQDFAAYDQSTYNKTDESLKIISENKLDTDHFDFSDGVEKNEVSSSTPVKQKAPSPSQACPVKPMTSFQSFTGPVIPPENEYENIVSMPPERNKINYNLLSPRRSLSNNGSQSSENSQFSKQTVQSSRTSYPTERESINPLVENLKRSDIPNPFSYPSDPFLNNAMQFQRHSMPASDVYNNRVSSFRQPRQDLSMEVNDKYKQDAHRQQPHIPADGSAPKGISRSERAIGPEINVEENLNPNVGSGSEVHDPYQKKVNIYHSSKGLEMPIPRLRYSGFRADHDGELYHEPKEHCRSQSSSFHVPHRSTQSFTTDELHGPDNYRMLEGYQSTNQRPKENKPEETADVVSYDHRLAPSADFRDVLETLDNMSPSSQKSKDISSEAPGHYALPKTPVKSKGNAAYDEGYHTEYEERDGKLVEVLILDDDSYESIHHDNEKDNSLSPSKFSQHSSPNRSHEEILRMCEDTATNAKKIILQLVNDKKNDKKDKKARGKKRLSRPPPPPATTKEVQQVARLSPRQNYHRRGSSIIGQEHYLRNLQRAMKPRP
ncbi:hypothetical protein ZYGR_0AN00820 [Zygosaccharomyces rouxii]|uniref:Uncharacterized protein n=1 Tax=Zygosaccharomyces rouxii TaxID=4956 RepID=A0A1Q3AFU8_ZYGRO|nr:hypothetical protein ZYGR_0AN00820 [Zygosaccharomyces rouxii]